METVAENVRVKPYWLINRTVGLLSMNSYIVHLHLPYSNHFYRSVFVFHTFPGFVECLELLTLTN